MDNKKYKKSKGKSTKSIINYYHNLICNPDKVKRVNNKDNNSFHEDFHEEKEEYKQKHQNQKQQQIDERKERYYYQQHKLYPYQYYPSQHMYYQQKLQHNEQKQETTHKIKQEPTHKTENKVKQEATHKTENKVKQEIKQEIKQEKHTKCTSINEETNNCSLTECITSNQEEQIENTECTEYTTSIQEEQVENIECTEYTECVSTNQEEAESTVEDCCKNEYDQYGYMYYCDEQEQMIGVGDCIKFNHNQNLNGITHDNSTNNSTYNSKIYVNCTGLYEIDWILNLVSDEMIDRHCNVVGLFTGGGFKIGVNGDYDGNGKVFLSSYSGPTIINNTCGDKGNILPLRPQICGKDTVVLQAGDFIELCFVKQVGISSPNWYIRLTGNYDDTQCIGAVISIKRIRSVCA